MSNLEQMRTMLKRELHDEEEADQLWNDEELDRCLSRAVREFSTVCPRQVKAALYTVAGSREVDISALSDRVRVYAVEYPSGQEPPAFTPFTLWGNTLSLADVTPDGTQCNIYYGALHVIDASGSTIPAPFEEIIISGAAGYAVLLQATATVNRINTGGSRTPEQFLTLASERLACFRAELRRIKKLNVISLA